MKIKRETTAMLAMIGTMLIFGTIGLFRRSIPLSSEMIACLRGFAGAGFLLIARLIRGKGSGKPISAKRRLIFLLTGALMGFNWVLLFEAYTVTTIPIATLCYYMAPTFMILASPIAVNEKLTAKKLICAAAAIVGMVFVSGVLEGRAIGPEDAKGVILGTGAAILYAGIVLTNKKAAGYDPLEKSMTQLFAAGLVMIPYLALTGGFTSSSLTSGELVRLLIVCFVHTGTAYLLYFWALDYVRAQSAAILSYIDPVFAIVLSAVLIPEEKLTTFGLIGGILIIGAALVSELNFKKNNPIKGA